MKTLRWGIMGDAKIARDWVIPAIRESHYAELVAVASRDLDRAIAVANSAGIPSRLILFRNDFAETIVCGRVLAAIFFRVRN